MARVLRAAAMGLADLLAAYRQFVVPEFQRVYGWGEVEIARLLSDILGAMAVGGRRLFLGTIYLAVPEGADVAHVADGQQRLLTATILYAVLRDLLAASSGHALDVLLRAGGDGAPKFVPRGLDAEFLQRWVQAPGATRSAFALAEAVDGEALAHDDPEGALSESQRNIISNRDAVTRRLQDLMPDQIAALVAFLAERTDLVVISAPTLEEARNAYASTQTRGLRQAETDKLKAELIGDCPAPLRTRLAGQWEECEARLGKDDLADLLHCMIVIAAERRPQHAIEVDLLRTFGLPQAVERFITADLVPYASAYQVMCEKDLSGSRARRRIGGHLVTLARTTHDAWRAPALLALRLHADDLAMQEALLHDLECLAASMMIRGTDPNQMMERYLAVVREMKVQRGAAIPALQLTEKEKAETRAALADSRFGIRDRFRMPLLLKLNDLLSGNVQAIDPKTVSCEHILPRNVNASSPWRAAFTPPGGRYQGGRYVHMLGNLTILPHEENRQADTHPYAQKRVILKRSTYALSKEAATWKTWTPPVVEQRTERLRQRLIDHWRLA